MTLLFYDAAYPPASPPVTDGVAFYIGGDAVHVWSTAEVTRQTARYRLPIFVRSNPATANATTDVTNAVIQLHALSAPKNSLVAWDTETASDPAYILGVYHSLQANGFQLIVYGSQSVVGENQNPNGLYWGADWTNRAHIDTGDVITQWISYDAYDESSAMSTLPFWDTHPTPSSEPAWQVTLMQSLPDVTSGSTGGLVRTIQGLCCARGYTIAIDGSFGPDTQAAVIKIQNAAKLTADGVVGPDTWPVLITGS
jgi:hypothetical protein